MIFVGEKLKQKTFKFEDWEKRTGRARLRWAQLHNPEHLVSETSEKKESKNKCLSGGSKKLIEFSQLHPRKEVKSYT